MNRLYYSKKQECIAGANLVNVNGTWVKYTQWNSHRFSDAGCNWDDAVLVLETEDEPQIKTTKPSIDFEDNPFVLFIETIIRFYDVQSSEEFKGNETFDINQSIKDLDKQIDSALASGDKDAFMKLTQKRNMLILEA
jgi:uncharacterized protein YpiB (UPF0302 family)